MSNARNLARLLPNTSGQLPDTAMASGSVLQVVQGTSSGAVTVATTSYTDIGLTATITPTSATSKILVLVASPFYLTRSNAEEGTGINVVRDSTSIYSTATWKSGYVYAIGSSQVALAGTSSAVYLDSPAKTTATVYKVQAAVDNTANGGQVVYQQAGTVSTITLMEIAA